MAEEKLTRVGSRLITDLRLRLADEREYVIRGLSHPTTDGMVVTENVPAEAFDQWLTEHALFDPVRSRMIFVVPDDFDATPQPKEYGFQPALDRALNDPDQVKLMERGTPEEPEPVTSRTGVFVPLPDPLPEPPTEEVHTRPAPSQEPAVPTEEKPQVVKVPPTPPAPASDSPKQDITLNPGGAGTTSSNQTAAPVAPPAATPPA